MSARQELWKLYEQWRSLTEAEAEAIRSSSWGRLSEWQDAKFKLRQELIQATEAFQTEQVCNQLNREELECQFRTLIGELILLETRNGELLAVRQQAAKLEQMEMDRTHRNLRQIQRSYAPPRSALWQSYS